jgi:hypothetical protein
LRVAAEPHARILAVSDRLESELIERILAGEEVFEAVAPPVKREV